MKRVLSIKELQDFIGVDLKIDVRRDSSLEELKALNRHYAEMVAKQFNARLPANSLNFLLSVRDKIRD